MLAHEKTCDSVYSDCDWSQDGRVTLVDFATFARSWRSRDPNGPPFDHNLWPNPWNAKVNLYMDNVIDANDLRIFAQWYLWAACWYHQPPAGLTMDACNDPNIYYVPGEPYYDPNEPYDPNEYGDPNDPNSYGIQMMGQSSQMSVNSTPTYDGVTAEQLQEAIDFLYEVAAEGTPEDASILYEFIPTLEDELSELYRTVPGYDFTQ